MNKAIDFFSQQFDRQIDSRDYALNVFEERTLRYLQGNVLDLGCGLGNLSIAAAERGHRVTALDACKHAVEDLQRRAEAASLPVEAVHADLSGWSPPRCYDSVVSIGLLMFVDCAAARRLLDEIRRAVTPGGVCVLNVLIEGTTYMKMFDENGYCLFPPDALLERFADWTLLDHQIEDFPTPEPGQIKRFATVVARRPSPVTDQPALQASTR